MPQVNLNPARSALLVIDVQPTLTPHIHDGEKTIDRIAFLVKIARLLEIPVIATEQNPSRMGSTERILADLVGPAIPKMSFSAVGSPEFVARLRETGRDQIVVTGFETHICVSLTALQLVARDYEVVVCPDAVSSRTMERHKLGMERIRDGGVVPAHTEAVAYEWLQSAEDRNFRQALAIVKEHTLT